MKQKRLIKKPEKIIDLRFNVKTVKFKYNFHMGFIYANQIEYFLYK